MHYNRITVQSVQLSGCAGECDKYSIERGNETMENVYIMDHPLIQHKISMLRNKNTGTNEFRKLVEEIGILMDTKP